MRRPLCTTALIALFLFFFPLLHSCNEQDPLYEVQGIFEAETILVASPVDGQIARLAVSEGQRISTQETIAQIDTLMIAFQRDYIVRQQETATTAGVISPASLTEALDVQIASLEKEQKRIATLVSQEVVAKNKLDEINAKLAAAKAQKRATTTQIEKQNAGSRGTSAALAAQRGQVEELIARSTIKAPIDGTILTVYSRQGEYTAAGRPIVKMADLSTITLRIYLTPEQLSLVKLGDVVEVYNDMGVADERPYEGIISWISEEAEFTPKNIQTSSMRATLIYAAKVRVPNDGYLKIGQYGKAILPRHASGQK